MRAIFISYRRSDSAGEAGRLYDDLIQRFSENAVFMDVDAIAPGRDFRKAIQENIEQCSVLLALIGPQWLGAQQAAVGETDAARRIDNPGDYLRTEIGVALSRDIAVIPVLVRGATMPQENDLPGELKELAYRNAVELTHMRWKSDMELLVQALKPYVEPEVPKPGAAPAPNATATVTIPQAKLENIQRELARYIGPIAAIVIKRSANKFGSVQELCKAVAQEIDSVSDRETFLATCRNS